jgi:predicted metalloprotease with PDZ domain
MDFSRDEPPIRLVVGNPASGWYRAGLRTGDVLRTLNAKPVTTSSDFFAALRGLHIGDTVTAEVDQGGSRRRIPVPITSYVRARVRIVDDPAATAAERARRAKWLAGW